MMKSEEKNEMVKMMMGLCESERKIKQQYDQLVKCNSAKGLTLAQVGEFANCLIEAKNELQLKRHLLTTGWSTFVSSKRLVAGDAFVFLRVRMGIYE
ncbi:hypothetical protein AALP_AA6G341400 [Arabis alpina]|uniref:TF-B3 domain-containing protein n=1 Tax=Arabis alpina TaxID=50452 RepID=A0A087GTI5_ARAAL|nr:hypothetical protein AALP_AA6G341400 [Arabis alpina]